MIATNAVEIINLTIVECKFDIKSDTEFDTGIINLTIVECK